MNELLNKVTQGDCLEVMVQIPDKSVDMILCDLPYGTTALRWDSIIPFEPLWEQYERIIKDDGAIVLTASQPFTSALVMSNPKIFRYSWVWKKSHGSFATARKQPLKRHEDICIFSKKPHIYNPQMTEREGKVRDRRKEPFLVRGHVNREGATIGGKTEYKYSDKYNPKLQFPKSVIKFPNAPFRNVHPTQKPVALFEYLIKTYTSEGETVLDNCLGSGTTAVAAINTGRNFIGIEREPEYVAIANQRIAEAKGAVTV